VFELVKDLWPHETPGASWRLQQCRALFFRLCKSLSLKPSKFHKHEVLEALAVSFLVCPERLVWNRNQQGAFLGVKLLNECKDEFFVVALMRNSYQGLQCLLSLPVTDWVLHESKVVKPKQTVKFITDSTFDGFRYSCCMSLRNSGYDVRLWYCKLGAWEEQIATKIFTSERTDLCIASPNGNRFGVAGRCETSWVSQEKWRTSQRRA
jgi:hypothetical protein